jgi:rare lipoprotein A
MLRVKIMLLALVSLAPFAATAASPHGPQLDHSGREQKGRASYYSRRFTNHRTADGTRFDPASSVAASKTLPLGTTARVTNLENGRSATVRIGDRGPLGVGRVVDVSPHVADQLELKKSGVAPVVVAPIAVPQPDGTVRLGSGAAALPARDVEAATRETEAASR